MAKVKRGVITHARHKKIIDAAKGYYGRRKNVFRVGQKSIKQKIYQNGTELNNSRPYTQTIFFCSPKNPQASILTAPTAAATVADV